jgi:hypothetical protein
MLHSVTEIGFCFHRDPKMESFDQNFRRRGEGRKKRSTAFAERQGAVDVQAVVVCPVREEAQEVVSAWRGGSWIEEGASPSSQKKKGPRLIHPVEREGNREGSYGYGYDRLEITNNPFYVCYLNRPNE